MSVMEFLNEADPFRRNLMVMIAEKYMELQHKLDLNRANLIANAVGKMLGGR